VLRTVRRRRLSAQVALEVGDDGPGDLAQVGGVGQQPGQVTQLAGRELESARVRSASGT
jgi:hypothetical protein